MQTDRDNLASCPVVEQTYDYICGRLNKAQCAQVAAHIVDCLICRETITVVKQAERATETAQEQTFIDNLIESSPEALAQLAPPADNPDCAKGEDTLRWFSGQLLPDRQNEILSHLTDCDNCRRTIVLLTRVANQSEQTDEQLLIDQSYHQTATQAQQCVAEQLKPAGRPVAQIAPIHRWPVTHQLALAASILLMLSVGGWYCLRLATKGPLLSNRRQLAESLVLLRQLTSNARPTELRLSGLDYAPYHSSRGDNEIDRERLKAIETRLTVLNTESASADTHQSLARVFIIAGQYEAALAELEKALMLNPTDPMIHNDLAVAEWAVGNLEGALGQLNLVLTSSPDRLEALFNRALLHQQLHHVEAARADWQHYLQLDAGSPWALEAKKNLAIH